MAQPPPALRKGERIGKYEVLGRLSSGGMAELYLAFLGGQGGFRKFVALKRVLPAVAADRGFVTMFLDEARITAALTHPNIAQVFELVESPSGELVLALEFISGQNVSQLKARAAERGVELSPGFCCRVVRDLLLGLHFAHTFVEPVTGVPTPVVHRDVNPRNVMVTYSGSTKVVDFGIAKARGRLGRTETGVLKGTLHYMSPEQVNLKNVDGRSDVFSAAHMLYELLARRPLFPAVSDSELMELVSSVKAPSLRKVAQHLPGELCEVVMKGLTAKPDRRWQSAREFARALEDTVRLDDEGDVAQVMTSLFDDKVALTRALLQSSAEPTAANLAELSGGVAVPPGPAPTVAQRPRLADVSLAPTEFERPAPSTEKPADTVDAAGVDSPTEAELAPVADAPRQRPTANERAIAPTRLESAHQPEAPAPQTSSQLVWGLLALICATALTLLWLLFR